MQLDVLAENYINLKQIMRNMNSGNGRYNQLYKHLFDNYEHKIKSAERDEKNNIITTQLRQFLKSEYNLQYNDVVIHGGDDGDRESLSVKLDDYYVHVLWQEEDRYDKYGLFLTIDQDGEEKYIVSITYNNEVEECFVDQDDELEPFEMRDVLVTSLLFVIKQHGLTYYSNGIEQGWEYCKVNGLMKN
jgi:hypothetical protein